MEILRDDRWDMLRECLPGLREPPRAQGMDRQAVRALLTSIEAAVSRSPASVFDWDGDGTGWLVAERSYRAGRFSTPSIAELEARFQPHRKAGNVTFSVLLGDHPLTDIGALQAMAAPRTMFQVASQFNCLEAPRPALARIADYVNDNTQGPRASVSAFPGTFLRHYAAPSPDGTFFTQSEVNQINLLADVIDDSVAQVRSGYLTADSVVDPAALERALEAGFKKIRVGVHDDVEVVLGRDWGGPVATGAPTVAQVFTSTMALGLYSDRALTACADSCEWLLRAAYLGTLLAALDLQKDTAVLTLIGGGAFGNSLRAIWDAVLWAIDYVDGLAPSDLRVVLNARVIGAAVPRREVVQAVQSRKGIVVTI